MHSTDIRNLLGLYWQKISLRVENRDSSSQSFASKIKYFTCGLLIIQSLLAQAQISTKLNQAEYDARTVRFGYFLGLPLTHFNLKYNDYYVLSSPAYAISSPNTVGLKMGGIMNVIINEYFDFRFQPTVAIYEREMDFKYPTTATLPSDFLPKILRQTAWFEIPLMIKYKSERRGNERMYIFAGVNLALETNAVSNRNKRQFDNRSTDFSIEYGVGLEMFKEYFKLTPELRFSHGLVNLMNPVNIGNPNSSLAGVSSMTTHTVSLCFLFE